MAETPDTGEGEVAPDAVEVETTDAMVLDALLNVAEAVNALNIAYGHGPLPLFTPNGPTTNNKQLWQDGQLIAAALQE